MNLAATDGCRNVLEELPDKMKGLEQFACYRNEPDPKDRSNLKRVPYNAGTGKHASISNPKTWRYLEDAARAWLADPTYYHGVVFALTKAGRIVGGDLDHCRDKKTGVIADWAIAIKARFPHTYWEITPSGEGLRFFLIGALPAHGRKKGDIELYDCNHFLSVTGNRLEGAPSLISEEYADELLAFHLEVFGKQEEKRQERPKAGNGAANGHTNPLSDEELLILAKHAKNGERFASLYAGNYDGYYPSQSEADLSLCSSLAFFCGPDPDRIDRLFRGSGLYRDKWGERHFSDGSTYGEATIQKALAGMREFYSGSNGRRQAAPEPPPPRGEEVGAGTLPVIAVNADLTGMVDQVEAALMKLPGPEIYQRSRLLCQIAPAGKPPKWLHRPPDSPTIVRAGPASLRECAARAAYWAKYDKREKTWSRTIPPLNVLDALAARVRWKFSYLEGVLCAPTLRPDGVVLQTPGYDPDTGLYLDFGGTQFPPIPEMPTRDDARDALDLLARPFCDFPFKEPYHMSAVLAAILTLVGRFTIPGNVPAFPVSSTMRGSGKGLLVNVIATIGTGRVAPSYAQTTDEAEEAKRLLSIALAGDSCIHIDNCVHPFGSGNLDKILTAQTVADRLLGVNETREVPWSAVIFASGNNLSFLGDMVRRVAPVLLAPQKEHPEERDDFQHPRLLDWVRQERPRLVTAAVTTLRAYCVAGRPKQKDLKELGSFEEWSALVRHCLVWAGFPDPCSNRRALEAERDVSYEALATLLECWAACYPEPEAPILRRVIQDISYRKTQEPSVGAPANEWNALQEALGAYQERYDGKLLDGRRLGPALNAIEGRVIEGRRLVRKGKDKHTGAFQWGIETTGT